MLVPVAALAAFAAAASVAAAPAGSSTPVARDGNHGYASVKDITHYRAEESWCQKYAASTPYRVILSNDFLYNTPPAFCRNVTITAVESGKTVKGLVVGDDDYAFYDIGISQAIYDELGVSSDPVEVDWSNIID